MVKRAGVFWCSGRRSSGRSTVAAALTSIAIVAAVYASMPGPPSTAWAQDGADIWVGTVAYADDSVEFEFGDSEVIVTRLEGTDAFTLTAFLEYRTGATDWICSFDWRKTFNASGELNALGTAIEFEGIETVQNTSTCPEANLKDDAKEIGRALYIDGGELTGVLMNGDAMLTGPSLVSLGSGATSLDAVAASTAAAGTAAAADEVDGRESIEAEVADDAVDPSPATAETTESTRDESDDGGVPWAPLVVGGAVVAAGAAGWELKRRRTRRTGDGVDDAGSDPGALDGDGEDDDSDGPVSLELTYPAGRSPTVFRDGWVFGARCIRQTPTGPVDLSAQVEWSGSGDFHPPIGAISRPRYVASGPQTINLSVTIHGERHERTYPIVTVEPVNRYARIGSLVSAQADAHGCPACPHPVSGELLTGSPNVTVGGVPAARVGDTGIAGPCCGPNTFRIQDVGDADEGVLIDGRPAARIGAITRHCGGGVGTIRS